MYAHYMTADMYGLPCLKNRVEMDQISIYQKDLFQ